MIIICAALEQPVSSALLYQPLKHWVSWSPDLSWAPAWTHCVSGDLVLHCSPLLGHTQHMESCPRSCSLIPQTRTDQHCLTMSDLPPAQRNTLMKLSFYQVIAFFNTPVVVLYPDVKLTTAFKARCGWFVGGVLLYYFVVQLSKLKVL